MGYHINSISKGVYGEFSKIQEEVDELEDAIQQKAKILQIVEICDLYGAIQGYLEKYHPGITMDDVRKMSELTHLAFLDGSRKSEIRIDTSNLNDSSISFNSKNLVEVND